ncbi:uncharacterized protein GVI51_A03091 [Nakaseomyces glabratus]|uniref:Crossover junction endonuclease MUS81 n=1 Tax=Candida glabrata (strain ATCC 2001 / BCRC 20586 / JCM 3761 / NBRC 0622 / NRRL Y-65 / CBS 138) TaxID=284593 RepID=MUS81_CANGA|nr:uncharacterized protein CAGL0A03256g [Nakaseomyces glabratus]Q6FYA6.1 RecName: Full=Crossover junction endonuclease MUS81 [Nakaseomyces glabratus CBS 138]KAH7591437.1 ERCC4 domain [Nakaseomyces glabratus]KAH7591886.1 ERCC4 domain [Nakaseomyces glabratus]KAH7598917.1 ERCC4 domain [Nakaseomyces glabratus]KAH7609364.1 ERCC4 domain [Nakaseomyces glabratus]KAH7609773.1 ERCC4 domain [Nakaseomyces glabratus]|eukprot:XP_444909.1 uncharacterized protein CAGL0A03256g [[Candida] glabrata]
MLPDNLKDLYVQWLQELIDSLSEKQEQLINTYSKAKKNLIDHDGVFYYPKDLLKVKGIGATIAKRLEARLVKHCEEIGVDVPRKQLPIDNGTQGSKSLKRVRTQLRIDGINTNDTDINKPVRKKRKYIPKKRSGAYAILLALLELGAQNKGVIKPDIIEAAQKYTDHSMTPNYTTKEFYSAWSSIAQLKKHELVLIEGRPQQYTLTEEGLQLADTLRLADGIDIDGKSIASSMDTNNAYYSDEHTADFSALKHDLSGLTCAPIKDGTNSSGNYSILEKTFGSQDFNVRHHEIGMVQRSHTFGNGDSNNSIEPLPRDTSEFTTQPSLIQRRRFESVSYELWQPGTYEIYPVIDHREVRSHSDREFFFNAFKARDMKSEIRQLSLGDIIWVAKNKTTGQQCILNTIIERKRLDDLAMSIRDNRFMEQKNRLEKSGCKHKYYLIEETIGSSIGNMADALKTTLWIILVYYRFSMIRTVNAEDSVDKLHALHTVICESYKHKALVVLYPTDLKSQDHYRGILSIFQNEFERSGNLECCHTFDTFQDIMGKRELKTIKEITIHILMLVRGVSLEKAVFIQRHFPTLNHLLNAYRKCNSQMEAKLMMFQKFGNAPGAKKITKQLSEKLAETFAF